MKFVSLNGYIDDQSSFISITIEGGNNSDSIGDQIWINKEGTEMQVLDYADADVLKETEELFQGGSQHGSHRRAFRGAMRRMGITY